MVTAIIVGVYMIVGIPSGVYLGFIRGYGLYGLYIGMNIAVLIVTIALITFLCKLSIPQEVDKIQQKIASEKDKEMSAVFREDIAEQQIE